jgi:uncharacterized delta-60 repeat protein
VDTPIPPSAVVNAVAVDSQGRTVAAGWSGNYPNFVITVARYTPGGVLDPSFNGTGVVTTAIGTFAQANAVAIDSQNRIVVAGYDGNNFALVRYTPTGAPDGSFGSGGVVTTPLGASANALSVVIDSQGRIIAGGYADTGAESALVRYTDGGTPDSSFGTGGKVITPIGTDAEINSMALDSQGRIVAAGYSFDGTNYGLAVARYNQGGGLDPTFGSGGIVTPTPVTMDDGATGVAIDPQGRIVVGGHSGAGSSEDFAAWRFDDAGAPDPTFGGGRVVTPVGAGQDDATSLALDAQGRILQAGSTYNGSNDDFGLVRLTPGGALDSSFGSGGKVITPFGASSIDIARGIAIGTNQRIVVAGNTGNDFALARYIDDLRPPTVTITSGPAANSFTRDPTPTFGFSVDDPTATTGCLFDSAAAAVCSSPFTPSARLGDGRRTFTVAATDPAGNASSATRTFTVDTKKPKLGIRGPSKIRTRHKRARARFKLKTNEKSTLRCKLDRHKAKRCKSPYRTPKLRLGKHKLQVTATDRAGNKTSKTKKFRIVHPAP